MHHLSNGICMDVLCIFQKIFQLLKQIDPIMNYERQFLCPLCRNHSLLLDNVLDFMIVIFKALRVATLIPPNMVVDISTRMKLHWYLKRLSPMFCFREQRHIRTREGKVKNLNMATSGGGLLKATVALMQKMKEEEEKKKERGKLVYAGYILKKGVDRGKLRDLVVSFGVACADALCVGWYIRSHFFSWKT